MPLASGTTLGPYEIEAPLGAGGMGEVYKARDTRLDRTVAIKVLPEHVAQDPDLKARFEREAKTISSLNHPHICTLHDIGNQDGIDFLVMEYLDGETLAQRLEKGALPLDQALKVAIEIADALDKAHRQGIVHRDLKPGNIMLTAAGTKLLDFGLAKLRPPRTVGADGFSAATTQSEALTGRGTILGTLQYMTPEQLEGKEADATTDIFAFGAVVYEMVTGRRAFEGSSQASLISGIMSTNPAPMASLQEMSPPTLDRIVKTCLAKNPEDRWQSAGDLRRELQWVTTERISDTAPGATARRTGLPGVREWLGVTMAVVLAVAVTWLTVVMLRDSASSVTSLSLNLPDGYSLSSRSAFAIPMTISPDDRRLVFSASDGDGAVQLYVREMEAFDARPILETEGGYAPFFSPDGQWVGFVASGSLMKVPVAGGSVVTIAEAVVGAGFGGASWGPDGQIVFAPTGTSGLFVVPATGGVPESLTTPDAEAGELSHAAPQVLPGGNAVLMTMRAGVDPDATRVEVLSIDSGARQVIVENGVNARYATTGHVIYAGGVGLRGALWGVPFDLDAAEVTGPPVRVLETVRANTNGFAYFTVTDSGALVYAPDSGEQVSDELMLVDAAGRTRTLAEAGGDYRFPRLSPNGEKLAVTVIDLAAAVGDIWILELDRSAQSPVTTDGRTNHLPVWSPDGRWLTFSSGREGAVNLFRRPVDGSRDAERLTDSEQHQDAGAWSPDGRWLVFAEADPETGTDIWMLDTEDGTTRPFLQTPAVEEHPQVSPDGQWLAYSSDRSGSSEVYVRAFPDGGARDIISPEGGTEPLWARDGQSLFFRRGNGIFRTAIETGPPLGVGATELIVEGPYHRRGGFGAPNYDVTADGAHFVVSWPVARVESSELRVVQNWFDELQRLVPTP